MVGAKDGDDNPIYAENISENKLQIGDMVRFAQSGQTAEHWATFLMLNSSGEPVVFSKSGKGGPNEFGTTKNISRNNGYGPVAPNGEGKTGYYRKLPNAP